MALDTQDCDIGERIRLDKIPLGSGSETTGSGIELTNKYK
jgi:hypothetical protein